MSSNPNESRHKFFPQRRPVGFNATFDQVPPSDSTTAGQNSPTFKKIATDLLVLAAPRTLHLDIFEGLMESLGTVGQVQPISVCPSSENPGKFEVICGVHRVAAAKKLNWPSIDALVFEGDGFDLPLIEIAENLHRKELSVYEKACLQTKWLKLVQQKVVQTAQPGGIQPHDKGYSRAARTLGRGTTREEVRRSEMIAGIADEVIPYLIEHELENHQGALLDIAKGPTVSDQINIARGYGDRSKRSKQTSRKKPPASSDATGVPVTNHPRTPAQPTDQFPALPAFLDRRDVDKIVNALADEWASCRLRNLLLEASHDARNRFVNGTFLPEIGLTLQLAQPDQIERGSGGLQHDT